MRLIDADELLKSFRITKKLAEMTLCEVAVATWNTAEAITEGKPTVDAVPVVRCQNCRCWKQHTAVDIEGNLVYLDSGNCGARVTNKDDYCSLAVRREETK